MPDGLFHLRPSQPPAVDVAAIVREVVTFERTNDDTAEVERNVTVPVVWRIEEARAPWPILALEGPCYAPDGTYETLRIAVRIPCYRALEHEVRAGVERACLALAQHVEERRRAGYTFPSLVNTVPPDATQSAAGNEAAPASRLASVAPAGTTTTKRRRAHA